MIYTEGFLDDASFIYSTRVQDDLSCTLRSLEAFPRIGSSAVPPSVREQYGEKVLKLVVDPFDLIYEYDEDADTVVVYGLVPFRAAR